MSNSREMAIRRTATRLKNQQSPNIFRVYAAHRDGSRYATDIDAYSANSAILQAKVAMGDDVCWGAWTWSAVRLTPTS